MLILATLVSYVFIHGSTTSMMSGGNVNLHSVLATRAEYGNEFLWFKMGRRAYLVRDAATLERIARLFDPVRELDPDADRVRAKLRPLEKRESQIDHQIDALDEDNDADARARVHDLDREMRDIEAQLRVLEREEEEIDRRRDAREAEAERRMASVLDEAIRKGIARPVDR